MLVVAAAPSVLAAGDEGRMDKDMGEVLVQQQVITKPQYYKTKPRLTLNRCYTVTIVIRNRKYVSKFNSQQQKVRSLQIDDVGVIN